MTDHQALFELFAWQKRAAIYRVKFRDGAEYDLSAVVAGQDDGEPDHASANVVRTVRRAEPGDWPTRNAMFFQLADVVEVSDPKTGTLHYVAA